MTPISKFRGGWLYRKIQIQFKTGRPSQWKHPLRLLTWTTQRDFATFATGLEKTQQECAALDRRITNTSTQTRIAIQQWDAARYETAALRNEVKELRTEVKDLRGQLDELKTLKSTTLPNPEDTPKC